MAVNIDELVKEIVDKKTIGLSDVMDYVTDEQIEAVKKYQCPFCETKLEKGKGTLHSDLGRGFQGAQQGYYECGDKECRYAIKFIWVDGKSYFLPDSIRTPGLAGGNPADFIKTINFNIEEGNTTKDKLIKQAIAEYLTHKIDNHILSS
ncbi:hypothetical protein KY332_01520 [Candidatus Woesearchaeota archaeon]|nr:hypothetical protein [Candidatus Woesearchaeota archaeon]